VDKPSGLTSHDVVKRVRRIAGQRRCGHTGTLDPFATGLLILCLGKATRLAQFLSGASKSYLATVRFGFATDTYDRTGEPVGPISGGCPERRELESVLARFQGIQEQLAPPYSAKRIDGKRSHRLARAGLEVKTAPARVEVLALDLLELAPPLARLSLSVSSGTYVRALAHDIGSRLGCGAHLEELRRTRIGSFCVEEASTLEDLETVSSESRLEAAVLSPAGLLRDILRVDVSAEAVKLLVHGRDVPEGAWDPPDSGPPSAGVPIGLRGPAGNLIAVAEIHPPTGALRPRVVLESPHADRG
jgi:tRNA pseudouridine55 synthase